MFFNQLQKLSSLYTSRSSSWNNWSDKSFAIWSFSASIQPRAHSATQAESRRKLRRWTKLKISKNSKFCQFIITKLRWVIFAARIEPVKFNSNSSFDQVLHSHCSISRCTTVRSRHLATMAVNHMIYFNCLYSSLLLTLIYFICK